MNEKPKWWTLYLLFGLLIGSLFLIGRSGWDSTAKSLAMLAAIGVVFGVMALWVRANDGAIERAEYEQARRALAKSHIEAQAWRSHANSTPKPATLQEPLPTTGFGSARNRPHLVGAVPGPRAKDEQRVNSERNL